MEEVAVKNPEQPAVTGASPASSGSGAPSSYSEPSAGDIAEATRAYQQGRSAPEPDAMIAAIEKEIGQGLTPVGEEGVDSSYLVMDGTEEIFRCLNLTKSYGQGASYIEVIKGISFNVHKGEYIVVYGPSGSGKSTLLNLLAGLESPTRGEIKVRNHVLQALNDDDLAYYHREEIGLVFQNFNLLDSLSVWENVAFPLMLAGAPVEWRRHEALKMLERFGMNDYATHYPNQLSGGQQQRVAMARALIHDPEILLVDEPTGNLDSRSAAQVIDELDRLHKNEERTILLVTHSQVFLPYATRVFYISDGNLLTSDEHSRLNSP